MALSWRGHQLWSHLTGPRNQASHWSMIHGKCWKIIVIIQSLLDMFIPAMPAPSLTRTLWSSRVVTSPWTLCPCTTSGDGSWISRLSTPGDKDMPAPATGQKREGWEKTHHIYIMQIDSCPSLVIVTLNKLLKWSYCPDLTSMSSRVKSKLGKS